MKSENKLRIFDEMDEKFLEEANEELRFRPKKNIWLKCVSAAACALLVCGLATVPLLNHFYSGNQEKGDALIEEERSESWITTEGNMICVYENGGFDYVPFSFLAETELDSAILVTPEIGEDIKNELQLWKTFYERPILVSDKEYSYVYRKINLKNIERKIGETTVKIGWDEEKKEEIVCSAELYAISGIDTHYAIAVKLAADALYEYPGSGLNGYLLWYRLDVHFQNFAELVQAYDLKNQFYVGPAFVEGLMTGTGVVENIIYPNEENRIFCEKLLAVNGKAVQNNVIRADVAYIDIECGFLVAGGAFGMKIYEDGYLVTNIGGTLHTFDIGKENALDLIAYGKSIPEAFSGVSYSENIGGGDTQTTLPYNPIQTSGAYIPEETTGETAFDPYAIEPIA